MIYHFVVRESYSTPFLDVAAAFEREHGIPITTLYCTRRSRMSLPFRVARGVRRNLRRLPGPAHRLGRVKEFATMNAEPFRRSIVHPAHGVITAFPQILSADTIERFDSLVNFHPSVLPYYRGPAPIRCAFANGERLSGFTVHSVTPRIDDGPILFRRSVDISDVQTIDEVEHRLQTVQVPIFRAYLEHLALGRPFVRRIDDAENVYRVRVGYARES